MPIIICFGNKQKGSIEIFFLEVRYFLEYFLSGQSRCEEVSNICHTDSHSTNAGLPSALIWIESDSFQQVCHEIEYGT